MKRFFAFLLAALLGFTQPALATISTPLTIGNHVQATVSTTNVLTTVTNDCPVGSLAIIFGAYTTIADTLSSVTDNSTGGPNTWSVIDNTTTTGLGIGVAYANVTSDIAIGKTITATFGGSTISTISGGCIATGIASSGPLDKHNNTAVGTTSPSSSVSTGTLSQSAEAIYGLTGCASTTGCGALTSGTGFTTLNSGGTAQVASAYISYQIVAATSSVTWSSSWAGTSTANIVDVISFKGAATGSGASMMLTGVGQ